MAFEWKLIIYDEESCRLVGENGKVDLAKLQRISFTLTKTPLLASSP